MLNLKDRGIILMIMTHCTRILDKLKEIDENTFYNDADFQEIVAFNLLQIGELAKKLSYDFLDKYDKVSWKQIAGMRDRIVHGYDTINLSIIWNTAALSVTELMEYCEMIIEKESL